MRRPTFAVLSAVAALALSAVALAPGASAAPPPTGHGHRNVHVCTDAPVGQASCDAIRRDTVDSQGVSVQPKVATPQGYGPAQIRSAYGLTNASSGKKTVAIVDAYDAPTAEADLKTYRAQFGLPLCITANGCFHKVNQTGGTKLPRANGGWAQEISLDLDMVSAACPDCTILLVEATSASFADLGAGVNYAASRRAVAISNSYGGIDSDAASTAKAYDHLGVAITASTGDAGYGVESPASFPTVVAVGGTSLTGSVTAGWTESAWSGAGSGCSTLNAKPVWQTAADCGGKANADVSAVADPATGVAVYDSYTYQGARGWMVFGGTSASSPIIAGVYAMGTATAAGGYVAAYTWAHASGLHDITTGSNGNTCTTAVWCAAGSGWDGPTGLGTPNGTTAF